MATDRRGGGFSRVGNVIEEWTLARIHKLGPEATELYRLLVLPNTVDLATRVLSISERIQAANATLLTLKALPDSSGISRGARDIGVAEHLRFIADLERQRKLAELALEEGETRDELLSMRPDGCFCFGLGGKGLLYEPAPGSVAWSQPCTCPEGVTMRESAEKLQTIADAQDHEQERIRAEAEQARAELARLDAAGFTDRLEGMTWGSYPALESAGYAIQKLAAYGVPPANARGARGLYLWGEVGRGKSILAQLALRDWIRAGGSGRFIQIVRFLEQLRESFDPGHEGPSSRALLRMATESPLVVMDDLGAEYLTPWANERLFLIVNERYERKLPTIYTSNYDLDVTTSRLAGLAERVRGERIADRIAETCEQVELAGPNLRLLGLGAQS